MGRSLSQLKVLEQAGVAVTDCSTLELGDVLRTLPGRREVYRATMVSPQLEVIAKCFLPHPKQARDWRREWEGLLHLQAAGLPAPMPIAVCQDSQERVYVLMQYLPDAVTLGAFLESAEGAVLRDCMARLAELVTALQRVGARQTDQHADNWALAAGRLYLLDAGSYRFEGARLDAAACTADVAAVCVTLPPQAERFFRESLELSDTAKAALSAALPSLQQARVRRYYKKSQRACTEFAAHTDGEWLGMSAKQADPNLVKSFFQDPDALMELGERIKSGNTCTVQGFCRGDRRYVLKRYNQKPWGTRLRRALFQSRARRSWSNSWVLNMAFIPTASSVAFAEERGFPLRRSYLLMEQVNAYLLPDYVARYREDPIRLEALAAAVGEIWLQLERIAAAHGDLKATNWMVDAAGQVFLIDLDSFRFGLSASALNAGRKKDLKRFLENWKSDPSLVELFRVRMEAPTLL
ncbi:lipopolysaccharide kinase InaA family protein [Coraliomargarita sp. SDUM461004]|uniref:Lipopolysaccharide kinase InaA family protein n=1 Tax=Thalassobacterium sedimentorum TaxID=3041258 RepID=A0ABU1AMZ9_9BACT|nr:lipopolysaccharide kinase InaA family protein [Coraliomargarita sp. SDUM461004]MDQ8195141.1 lipopolysaccharide kinase InaA family protein [Coraliomargarita sp. SDUM461004]